MDKCEKLYFKRKNKLILESIYVQDPRVCQRYIATFMKNIESLGFTFSADVIRVLNSYNTNGITNLYKAIIPILKEKVGAHKQFNPMYANFPLQVMEAEDSELYINAILHYTGDWIGVRILPKYDKKERFPLIQNYDLQVIELGSFEDYVKTFEDLMMSKTSISQSDYEDLGEFLEIHKDEFVPDNIPYKEIMAFVVSKCIELDVHPDLFIDYFKTSTDVLRLVTAMSGGDVSLASNTNYNSFTRKQRRFILGLLDRLNNVESIADMQKYTMKWIRLGERLHPQEHDKDFPDAAFQFRRLRGSHKEGTFNGKVESALESGHFRLAMALLKKKPTLFARRLAHLLRLSEPNEFDVLSEFANIASKVTTPVLLGLIAHFRDLKQDDLRVFLPKGVVAKAYAKENDLTPIPTYATKLVVIICEKTLKERFSELESLGKVYLDPELKNYVIPFSQRSASKALRTVVRGSKFPLKDGNTIRFFVWWADSDKRADIDLSAVILDKDLQYMKHISYTNLRSHSFKVTHSGDITSAPNGASEFIDFDIDCSVKFGARYIVMNLYSYTGQPYKDLPECFAGWMMRKGHAQHGEIFEAKTVQNKFDLTADSKISIPLIIDLVDRTVLWTDLSLKSNLSHSTRGRRIRTTWGDRGHIRTTGNNVESNYSAMSLMVKAMFSLKKSTLYDLFNLHAKGRGELVEDIEDAETIFSVDEGVTPFDIEDIISNYL